MWPTIGGTRTYIFVYVLSMVVHGGLALYYCRRMRIRFRFGVAIGFSYVFGMVVGARILYDVLHHRLDWHNYADIHYYFTTGMWGGPLAHLAVAVAIAALSSRDRQSRLDLVALALPIPLIFAKVACFVNGCCYGAASTLPWALAYRAGADAPAGITRHPTQLYEILVLVAILVLFQQLDRRKWRGALLVWLVMFYGIGRPFTELFRATERRIPEVGPYTNSQAACMAAALLSIAILVTLRRQRTDSAARQAD